VQAIWLAPVTGHGVGSWTVTIKRLEGPSADKVFGTNDASNPHQEYLLWGVELGLAGILLLLGVMGAALRDAQCFSRPIKRATVSLLAALAVACLFNSALYDALVGDYFCVALGLLMALGLRTNNEAGGLMPKANM
jgi:O-antigen ligase